MDVDLISTLVMKSKPKHKNYKRLKIAVVLLIGFLSVFIYLPVTAKAQMVALFGHFIGDLIRSVVIIGTLLLIYTVIKNRAEKEE